MDVMTPHHPRWDAFIEELSRSLICARSTANARRVLLAMEGIDPEESLRELRALGGSCDCEIVFNLGHVAESAHA
jgi:hypothetical protein